MVDRDGIRARAEQALAQTEAFNLPPTVLSELARDVLGLLVRVESLEEDNGVLIEDRDKLRAECRRLLTAEAKLAEAEARAEWANNRRQEAEATELQLRIRSAENYNTAKAAEAQVAELRGREQTLTDALREYAWHDRACAAIDADGEWDRGNAPCNCGYDDALAVVDAPSQTLGTSRGEPRAYTSGTFAGLPVDANPAEEPERKPNAGNAIQFRGSAIYLDSPENTHGVKVAARIDDGGWLSLTVATDESVKGWTLSYNGRDIPIYIERDANPAEDANSTSAPQTSTDVDNPAEDVPGGYSFYVHTALRDYDTLAGTLTGYQTIAMSIDAAGRPVGWLYDYHCSSERKARHAHYVISKRLSRLSAGGAR